MIAQPSCREETRLTALNWVIEKDRLMLACDTLVTAIGSGVPLAFLPKVISSSDEQSIIAGTGDAKTLFDIQGPLHNNSLGNSVFDIANCLPEFLRNIDKLRKESRRKEAFVYLFGWSEEEGLIRGYGFSSQSDFSKTDLPNPGMCVSPPNVTPPHIRSYVTPPPIGAYDQYFVDLIRRQREADDEAQPEIRAGIGGEILRVDLIKNRLNVRKIYRFDDYAEMSAALAEAKKNSNR